MTTLAEQVAEMEARVATIARVTEDAVNAGWQVCVTELKRERDGLRNDAEAYGRILGMYRLTPGGVSDFIDALQGTIRRLEAALASAKVEGAREALSSVRAFLGVSASECVRQYRDGRYPAPASGEGGRAVNCERCGFIGGAHASYCTPPSAPEPKRVTIQAYNPCAANPAEFINIHITPDIARRIVGMAQGGTDA